MLLSRSEAVDGQTVQALSNLLVEFAYRVDFENGLTTAELFTSDGFYESEGQRSTGRAAIHEAYIKRAARGLRTSRHVFTNMRFRRLSDGRLAGKSIMLLFAEDGPPPHPARPLLVADVDDIYAETSAGILIASRTLTTLFIDPGAQPVLPLGHDSIGTA